jgi:hypothetical protein
MRYFLGFLAAIGLIIVVFILILRGFTSRTPESTINLLDYANTTAVMRLTVDGPIDAETVHDRYRIVVGRDEASIERTRGYEGAQSEFHSFESNRTAYANFLRALQLQGFTKGDPSPERADERGNCPDGSRYIFEIIDGKQKRVQRFWSTSCGKGTFGGSSAQVRQLFLRQIPGVSKFTANFGS